MRLRLPPRPLDVLVAVAVAVSMALTISVAQEDASRPPNAVAYLLGLAVGALLLARRRQPLLVLVGTVGVLMTYYALEFPAFSPALPLAVAGYSAALAGHLLPAAGLLGGLVLFSAGWQTLGEDADLLSVLGTHLLTDAALLAAVLLLGDAIRSRRALAGEVRARLERETERRVQEERLRIARELHDVVAHTLAAITVQAGAAADVLEEAPAQARESLRTIREQSREATAELRAAVGLLRGPAPRAPAPGLDALGGLVETAAGTGLRVDVAVEGEPRPLPSAVHLTAYRIVQESLTNVVRHAGAASASVRLGYEPGSLVVTVRDDGRGGGGNGAPGHGLTGMRERAAALGGALEAGPAPGGGFRVRARLPTGREGA
jgi:signal transduction histidine kinase